MMSIATNPITGDQIKTRKTNDSYRDGWERIFGKKNKTPTKEQKAEQKNI